MVRKKHSHTKNQTSKAKDVNLQSNSFFEDEIIYAMANTSVLLMSTMMGAFTQVVVNATGSMSSGMAEALGGKEAGDIVNQEIKQALPEVDEKIKAMISDIKRDLYSQMKQKSKELRPLLSDPTFEVGPKIIKKYEFNLPKLTQELNDTALAKYSQLLMNEDKRFSKMFKELVEWLSSMPKPLGSNQ